MQGYDRLPDLAPEAERALDTMLAEWAESRQLPQPALDRIRRSVLSTDAAYEPLTAQWWRRVLGQATSTVRATADIRLFLPPAWEQS